MTRKKSTKEIFMQIWPVLSKYGLKVLVSLILVIISSFMLIYAPKQAGQLVNLFVDYTEGNVSDMYILINNFVLLVGLYVAGHMLKLPYNRIMIQVSEDVTANLRNKFHSQLNKLPLNVVNSSSAGDILARMNNDLMNIRNFISTTFTEFFAQIIIIVLVISIIISTNVFLGLIYAVMLPVYLSIILNSEKKSSRYYKSHQNNLGKMIGYIGDTLYNHLLIQIYNNQDYCIQKFKEINENTRDDYEYSRLLTGFLPPITTLISNLANIALYIGGLYLLINGEISIGVLLSVILYGQLISSPLMKVGTSISKIQTFFASFDRILIFLNETDINEGEIILDGADIRGDIEFRDVGYVNKLGETVFEHFNLKMNHNETIVVTGKNTSGKTTLINLLFRNDKITSGNIYIDNMDIYDINLNSYHKLFTYFTEEKIIFEGTILENIGYGKDNYTFEEVKNAAAMVGLDKLIENLPQKYDTVISEEKNNISSGEKELICFARCVISDSNILIIDNPSHSLKLDNIIKDKTTIIITNKDQILRKFSDRRIIDIGH